MRQLSLAGPMHHGVVFSSSAAAAQADDLAKRSLLRDMQLREDSMLASAEGCCIRGWPLPRLLVNIRGKKQLQGDVGD